VDVRRQSRREAFRLDHGGSRSFSLRAGQAVGLAAGAELSDAAVSLAALREAPTDVVGTRFDVEVAGSTTASHHAA
jgi:hypothetical protein